MTNDQPYHVALTLRLAEATGELPPEFRSRHAAYLKDQQRPDGGFAGREGPSDLYYTAFGIRGLALLGELDDAAAQSAGRFLQEQLGRSAATVDFYSLILAASILEGASGIQVFAESRDDWRDRVAEAIEDLRRSDGGYAKASEGQASSTYHSFLAAMCLELIERPLVEPARLTDFVLSQRREDGGFVEIRAMCRSGANPTAAAIAVLRMLAQHGAAPLSAEVIDGAVDFLLDMQTDEGGLRANSRIPIADLLSTFTGLLTLTDLGAAEELDLAAARGFVHSLALQRGGFHGAAWDEGVDVEYTFYGIAAAALLQ